MPISQPYEEPSTPATPYQPTKDPFAVGDKGDDPSEGGLISNPTPPPDSGGI